MDTIKFKSQICTTIEQSERLLALGLSKKTADMAWLRGHENPAVLSYLFNDKEGRCTPAWSLHRLWELAKLKSLILDYEEEVSDIYNGAISKIEQLIKNGHFPKEYLV